MDSEPNIYKGLDTSRGEGSQYPDSMYQSLSKTVNLV